MKKLTYAIRIVILLVCFILCAVAYVIYGMTLIDFFFPIFVSFVIALGTTPFFCNKWKWFTTTGNKVVNTLCHMFIVCSIAYSTFMLCNYYMADSGSEYTEEVVVEKKKRIKKPQGTRRVRKMRYVSYGTRYEYYLDVVFSDSTRKEINVTLKDYNKVRTGKAIKLTLQKGLLGYPVIKQTNTR